MSERTDRDCLIDLLAIVLDIPTERAALVLDESDNDWTDILDVVRKVRRLSELGAAHDAACSPPPDECVRTTPAERAVLAERAKQRRKWGAEHDDEHGDGALAVAAAALAWPEAGRWSAAATGGLDAVPAPRWACNLRARHNERQGLVIAAALLLAEIERLDRAGGAR